MLKCKSILGVIKSFSDSNKWGYITDSNGQDILLLKGGGNSSKFLTFLEFSLKRPIITKKSSMRDDDARHVTSGIEVSFDIQLQENGKPLVGFQKMLLMNSKEAITIR